ncbi:spermatogenesis-associated protein 1 [Dipodomys spectabilis]|uniref:spermatogenesis-associated protein 1 n=1 Tax=Dipodomys spectabilis TaxID=105255 RepID=UPI001C54413B|nr:spermatogenesis-associated protein 1 [Dipodomys spectabilis]XP_042536323.1 spermatogenesis-associated protein 1 [Dipodomys spectabilis]XP_042536331.1 spermatogenesis-associated protein 1 [Dipodomys spectabilis]XP_042536338.1 spermatogenesis-associated protein 1 [Dipodomys spectabilis]XP_042536346.1 spermatogenesis-associated protein 1 [Dipodomys spectabilis]
MKREKKTTKISIGNYSIQTLETMLLNPSRPSSSELVELHVFYVPEGSWNYNLNTVSLEVINEFVSAGFIRVSPQLTLQALREHLGDFLGEDAVAEKFLFLKCIGNNLAVVTEKQESELKLKSFASPYALQPELYLLPVMDHLGNVYSEPSTVTLEEQQINNDIAEVDETIHQPVNVILSMDEPGRDPNFFVNTLKDLNDYPEEVSAEEKVTVKENQTAKNHIGNFEIPGSLEESSDYCSNEQSQLLWKNEDDITIDRQQINQLDEKEHNILPDLIDFPSFPFQPVLSSGISDSSLLQMERQKIIEQMKQVREERKYLENVREELNKKVEKLFEQSKLKRYQACDNWKKKYLETKKVTSSLEEVLTKLREDLELYYKKLLMQLEAREIKMRPKNLANISDSKNNLIIQITEVQHAIDQLKRKLDTDKMKLIIEVKMRKQAISDLRTLKTELAQKKISPAFHSQLVPGSVPS